ncbi:PQQ-binding-like beta-propeller repeat protein [Kribbella speibonae]|uniref:Pyrrolo-quinoline quinone n=1 Tax=Kribbella speibonae TaxID=1572660 RepID=A0ABY1ZYD4_9ACTN|nr:PQQ-binding-like beta-propeller repeat protein [Kribbella speibonae]TCC20095.1 Pyrrolo-quinoline quinone [Kribbella speibonae]
MRLVSARMRSVIGLREFWDETVPEALRDELIARYSAKRRNAYRERYVAVVLTAVEALDQLATDPVAVRLAAWYHRAVHDQGASAAEDAEASARLAEDELPGYGVSPARTAEVARLVRLTAGIGAQNARKTLDANGDVLHDAVNAVIADRNYASHASELRRDADKRDNDEFGRVRQRYADVRELLDSGIYRTQLARDQYDADARANLAVEFALLDGLLPAPWRGWQRGALVTTAVLTAVLAFLAAFGAARGDWREPAYSGDPSWPGIVLTLLAAAAIPALYWASRRTGRASWIVAGTAIAIGVIGLVVVWAKAPETNVASGVGQAVPLAVVASILLVLAAAAALAASRFTTRPRNRGQMLAAIAAAAAIVLITAFVIVPLQNAYLHSANEHLDSQYQLAGPAGRSQLTGGVLWTSTSPGYLADMVTTSHGIAVTPTEGTVEMLDPATGRTRWRYIRTDSSRRPALTVLNGGQQLLVEYDGLGYFVLDADTGERLTAWPGRTRDDQIQNADPLVTGRPVSKGSDKLYGTNLDGSHRWTYEPGNCTGISATATADTVFVELSHSCGGEADETLGLNLKDGKQLWKHSGPFLTWKTPVGGLIVGAENEGITTLIGLDPRSGEVKWRWPMPRDWGCTPRHETAGNLVLLITCPQGNDASSIVTAIDGASGRQVWTATAAVSPRQRYAVTDDARVVFLYSHGGCRLAEIGAGRTTYRALPMRRACGGDIAAAGNLILVSGQDGLTALR